jgi:hypothetical protein
MQATFMFDFHENSLVCAKVTFLLDLNKWFQKNHWPMLVRQTLIPR